ncbi:Multicopper oxidase [Acidisarcina polymorpha]|uniref:Multicopper oxidase n=1 Tax=Acidisarcina polymorpha TaxID=2211140 RepID=A0A2Z5G6R5_9BACT|nr:protease pro-enzyme activation domain-containing protein [Acidisarcina polymorpha]AXC14487.1 Multicopper oxidase [Acidisarcina polymorpha]
MHSFSSRLAGFCLLVFSAAFVVAQSTSQDRIVQPIQAGKVALLQGTAHPLAQAKYDQGPVNASMELHGMSLDFKPSAAQQASLTALLKTQQDPSSPNYRKWLTTEQYAAQFGMSQADIAKATSWLQSQGFTVDHVAESRNSILFSGTAALAEAAFHTQIHRYTVNGESHFANASAVSIPSALVGSVSRVGGLDDFKLKPRYVKLKPRTNTDHSQFTSGGNAPDAGSHYLAPTDFAVIYDLNPLYTAGDNGTGQTIGIIGQTQIVMSDITTFRSNAGLPTNNPTVFTVPNTTPGNDFTNQDINEADLDLEWSGGVAPNASIVFVNSGDVITSLQYAIANKINGVQIPILSISYGGCEPAQSSASVASLEASLQQANAQGQTVIGVAGDDGASDCDEGNANPPVTSAVNGLAVDYPGSSAFVTALGGSEFTGDGTAANPSLGGDQYWAGTGANDLLTSALSYIPEMAWNDTSFDISQGGGIAGGGGGASVLFAKPSWQTGVPGIPSDSMRDVPDLALNASVDHDGYLVCTQIIPDSDTNPTPTNADFTSSCVNGFRFSDLRSPDDETTTTFGGTSAAAPSFAGVLALIEQKLGVPQGLGNINPTLYTLAANPTTYASAFHDITTGNNIVPCVPGTPTGPASATQCPSSGSFGYSAGTGYDQATGLGSIDGSNLATAFTSVATKAGTTTTVAVSANPAVGATVTLTATVTPNTGATTPTGSVTFTVDGTVLGAAVPLASGGASTTTTFATGGSHTVLAAYSGDTNYYASTSTANAFTVATGTAAAPTTTAVTVSPASVPLGGSLTISATVTAPAGGALAGTLNFFAGATQLNPTPVAILPGANGVGTATYTVTSVSTSAGFTVGTTTITANYGGTAVFAASSGTAALTVTNPGITLAVGNITIPSASPGNSGTSTITLTSTGGYAGTVNLTATASSLNADYAISPTSVTLASGGTGTSSITIQTVAADLRKAPHSGLQKAPAGNRVIVGAAAAFGSIFLLGIPGFRRRRWPMLTALLLLGALGAGLGCGGGVSSASPSGTYTVTVTAADTVNSAITTSTNFTVTIR